jgi:hypothetical protein
VAGKDLIIDPSEYDLERVIADADEIRKYNPQRFEMQQLTAVVYDDFERGICVGYKDVAADEFWVRGHMPGMPLIRVVMWNPRAVQLCGAEATCSGEMVGFGGLEKCGSRHGSPVITWKLRANGRCSGRAKSGADSNLLPRSRCAKERVAGFRSQLVPAPAATKLRGERLVAARRSARELSAPPCFPLRSESPPPIPLGHATVIVVTWA